MKPLPATPENLAAASRIIREGGLVVVPTETVYGLAADALNADAVRKIFAAKARPSDNPLICHVASDTQVDILAAHWPDEAQNLAERFWPGPLTMVLPKTSTVPHEVTAGLETVAIRMPSHPTFRSLITLSETPIAAPSANLFMAVSPTDVAHLDPDLLRHVDMVLDGGKCEIGIESTVVDLSGPIPLILRPGMVSSQQIEDLLGIRLGTLHGTVKRSPGMSRRHYAPKARLRIVRHAGLAPALVIGRPASANQISMPPTAQGYAARLYGAIHQMDNAGLEEILVEAPPETAEWAAIWDRLRRAASALE